MNSASFLPEFYTITLKMFEARVDLQDLPMLVKDKLDTIWKIPTYDPE